MTICIAMVSLRTDHDLWFFPKCLHSSYFPCPSCFPKRYWAREQRLPELVTFISRTKKKGGNRGRGEMPRGYRELVAGFYSPKALPNLQVCKQKSASVKNALRSPSCPSFLYLQGKSLGKAIPLKPIGS